jgi:catechol-2,3-dioxygenase
MKKSKKTAKRPTTKKKAFKRPVFHHALLKTARMDEMIQWYADVIGSQPNFYSPGIAFLSNDGANHRLSLVGNPAFRENPDFRKYAGLHHLAFEYKTVNDLLDTWQRLYDEFGYEPHVAVHHGMTLSFYYVDPDGNSVELQADAFGDWKKSSKWMRESPEFKLDPIRQVCRAGENGRGAQGRHQNQGTAQARLCRRIYAGRALRLPRRLAGVERRSSNSASFPRPSRRS